MVNENFGPAREDGDGIVIGSPPEGVAVDESQNETRPGVACSFANAAQMVLLPGDDSRPGEQTLGYTPPAGRAQKKKSGPPCCRSA